MENLAIKLKEKRATLSVIGLGYVGLPIALAFANRGVQVVGFDIQEEKVSQLKDGIDLTGECSREDLGRARDFLKFTSDPKELKFVDIFIVAVPTPIDQDKTPDLEPLIRASHLIGQNFKRESIVVYESTVYPGVTEEVCVPELEKASGTSWSKGDFFVGYSPERINPGDREHTISKIVKVVSGQDEKICDEIGKVYELIVDAGVYRAESIKVAEAAKVIENTQRDLNIALMNELAIIFNKVGISTEEVLKAAGTKWNFLKFFPGLVGGHCIGVDPYYLTSKAEQLGYHPQVVLGGRRINDSMSSYLAEQTIKQLIKADKVVKGSRILVLGLTFKENVPDFRNSKIFDTIRELKDYGLTVFSHDPFQKQCRESVDLIALEEAKDFDCILLATPHKEFCAQPIQKFRGLCKTDNRKPVFIDIRWVYNRTGAEEAGFHYWRF